MSTLAQTSLTPAEQTVVDRWARRLQAELPDVRAVWLYGFKARGDDHEESDVDLLVICGADGRGWERRARAALEEIRQDEGGLPQTLFSVQVSDLAWLANRREIRSFFMQEVDRDKVSIVGPVDL